MVFGIDAVQVIEVVSGLAITYIAGKLISKSLSKLFEKTPFPEDIENAIVKISKYVIYVIGILVVIAFLGFDLISLIVGLGAFSIAISFATSTIIQNLVSGLLVQADRAFQIGDRIMIQGTEGKVEDHRENNSNGNKRGALGLHSKRAVYDQPANKKKPRRNQSLGIMKMP
jgi:small-conductance mechanosensitive channel